MKKVKIIDNFSFSGSYNFLADSMKLSTIPLSLRMTIPGLKNFGINISATLDPYDIGIGANGQLTRINKLMIANGKGLGRITNASTSIGYTFNSGQSNQTGQPAINNSINTQADLLNPLLLRPGQPDRPAAEAADDERHLLRLLHPVEPDVQLQHQLLQPGSPGRTSYRP